MADASHGRVYYDSESGSYYSLISHVHGGEELTAWQQTDSLPDTSGSYYLTGDVTLTSGQEMDVDVTRTPDHPECIRCGMCVKACPTGAVSFRCGLARGAKDANQPTPTGSNAVEK